MWYQLQLLVSLCGPLMQTQIIKWYLICRLLDPPPLKKWFSWDPLHLWSPFIPKHFYTIPLILKGLVHSKLYLRCRFILIEILDYLLLSTILSQGTFIFYYISFISCQPLFLSFLVILFWGISPLLSNKLSFSNRLLFITINHCLIYSVSNLLQSKNLTLLIAKNVYYHC